MPVGGHVQSRRSTAALAMLAMLLLAACGSEGPATRDGVTTPRSQPAPPDESAAMPASPSPTTRASAATAPMPGESTRSGAPTLQRDARLDGFGPLRFGMTTAQAKAAWPGLFAGVQAAASRRDCFHVGTGLPYFTLMFEGGRFVRYDAGDESVAAPGGGRRGTGEADVQALYRNALASRADRFAPGGKLLSMQTRGVAPSKLVFMLRPDGVVDEWRVGLLPQADYDEGCESAG